MPAHRGTRRVAAIAGLLVALTILAPACAKKYQAERDGKDVGESLCDVRGASTKERRRALADLEFGGRRHRRRLLELHGRGPAGHPGERVGPRAAPG